MYTHMQKVTCTVSYTHVPTHTQTTPEEKKRQKKKKKRFHLVPKTATFIIANFRGKLFQERKGFVTTDL